MDSVLAKREKFLTASPHCSAAQPALNKLRVHFMNQSKPHYNKLKRYWKFLLNIEEDLNDMSGRPMPSDVSAIAADIAEEFPGVYDCMPFLRFHG